MSLHRTAATTSIRALLVFLLFPGKRWHNISLLIYVGAYVMRIVLGEGVVVVVWAVREGNRQRFELEQSSTTTRPQENTATLEEL